MCVAGGRFPTQRACPDCLGFLGGPLRTEVCREEFELLLLTAVQVVSFSDWHLSGSRLSYLEDVVVDTYSESELVPGYCPVAVVVAGRQQKSFCYRMAFRKVRSHGTADSGTAADVADGVALQDCAAKAAAT